MLAPMQDPKRRSLRLSPPTWSAVCAIAFGLACGRPATSEECELIVERVAELELKGAAVTDALQQTFWDAQSLGIDPVYFGVLMVVTLSVGVITPPFGNVLFILVEIAEMPFEKVVQATAPFLIPIVMVISLLILVPELVTWLPSVIYN